MPFTADQARERLKDTYKNVSDTMARQFAKVWNNIFKETGDESRAFAGAYAAINKRKVKKKASFILAVIMANLDLRRYEVGADKIAEITGGTAKVWGHDSLLIEDAGPGVHLSFQHHGEVLEVEVGNGHPDQITGWLESRTIDMVTDPAQARELDIDAISADPFAFAEYLTAVFLSKGLRARTNGSKCIIAGRRDIVIAIQALFDRRAREAVQAYFSGSGGAVNQPVDETRPGDEAPTVGPDENDEEFVDLEEDEDGGGMDFVDFEDEDELDDDVPDEEDEDLGEEPSDEDLDEDSLDEGIEPPVDDEEVPLDMEEGEEPEQVTEPEEETPEDGEEPVNEEEAPEEVEPTDDEEAPLDMEEGEEPPVEEEPSESPEETPGEGEEAPLNEDDEEAPLDTEDGEGKPKKKPEEGKKIPPTPPGEEEGDEDEEDSELTPEEEKALESL